jgi:uncharacterized protein (TIRG00374 family)
VVTSTATRREATRPRTRWWRWGRWLIVAASLAGGIYVLAGNAGELQAAGQSLGRVSPVWVVAAVVVEAASYVAFGLSQARLIRAGGEEAPLLPVTGQAVAAQALANCLPAGPALATVYSFRIFRRLRISEPLAAWAITTNLMLFFAALTVLAIAGSEVAGVQPGSNAPDLRGLAVGVLGFLLIVALVAILLQRRGLLLRATHGVVARIVALRRRPEAAEVAERWVARLTRIHPGAGNLITAFVLLLLTWLTDLACLALAFPAVGGVTPWHGLLVAYCAGQLAAVLPITPGGLGVVEGSLTLALVAYGGQTATSLAAVLLYRLVSYWAVIPAGVGCHLGLRRLPPPPEHHLTEPVAETS